MTPQQAFDKALNGVRAQFYRRSVARNDGSAMEGCLYRGPNGLRCAVGHLISDKEYRRGMEGKNAGSVITLGMAPCLDGLTKYFLNSIQSAHDHALRYSPASFEKAMRDVAAEHGLTYTPPEMVDGHIVTPWFGIAEKPARPGHYQAELEDDVTMARFDGSRWHLDLPMVASTFMADEITRWRGIYGNEEVK